MIPCLNNNQTNYNLFTYSIVASRCPTRSVNIGTNILWEVKIDHIVNILKVNSSGHTRLLVLFSF